MKAFTRRIHKMYREAASDAHTPYHGLTYKELKKIYATDIRTFYECPSIQWGHISRCYNRYYKDIKKTVDCILTSMP